MIWIGGKDLQMFEDRDADSVTEMLTYGNTQGSRMLEETDEAQREREYTTYAHTLSPENKTEISRSSTFGVYKTFPFSA